MAPGEDAAALGDTVEFIIPAGPGPPRGARRARLPLFVTLPRDAYTAPVDFHLAVTDSATGTVQLVQVRFQGALMRKWLRDRPWIWIVLFLAVLMAGSFATLNKPEAVRAD